MSEIALSFIVGLLGVLSGAVGAYVVTKKALSHDKILDLGEEFIDNILEKAQTDAEFQKRIYVLGGFLGQGIKAGVGMGKAGGKFRFEDIFTGLIGSAAQKFLPNLFGQGQQQEQEPQNSLMPTA